MYNFTIVIISSALIFYCLYVFIKEYKTKRLFSPVSSYSAILVIHFFFPGLLTSLGILNFNYEMNYEYLLYSLIFTFLSFIMFQFGGYIALLSSSNRKFIKNKYYLWGKSRVVIVIIAWLIIGWITRFYIISIGGYFQNDRSLDEVAQGQFHALVSMVELFPTQAYIVALIFYYHRELWIENNNRWERTILLLGAFEFLYWIGSGRKLETIFILLIPVVIRYLYISKLPSRAVLIIGVVGIFTIFPATHYYRNAMDVDFGSQSSISSIPEILIQGVELIEGVGPALDSTFSRLNLNESVSASIRLIDTEVWELRYGQNYLNLLVILIPRFIWNDKPYFHYGTLFGHDSGILAVNNLMTSISVTYIGEAFLNFMWAGIVIFIIFGYVSEKLYLKAKDGINPIWVLFYMLYFLPMIYVGGTVAMYFGGTIKLFVFYSLVGVFLITRLRLYQPNKSAN